MLRLGRKVPIKDSSARAHCVSWECSDLGLWQLPCAKERTRNYSITRWLEVLVLSLSQVLFSCSMGEEFIPCLPGKWGVEEVSHTGDLCQSGISSTHKLGTWTPPHVGPWYLCQQQSSLLLSRAQGCAADVCRRWQRERCRATSSQVKLFSLLAMQVVRLGQHIKEMWLSLQSSGLNCRKATQCRALALLSSAVMGSYIIILLFINKNISPWSTRLSDLWADIVQKGPEGKGKNRSFR